MSTMHISELDKIMTTSPINCISNIWLTNFSLLFATFYSVDKYEI